MPEILLWVVMAVGPDFVTEARWAPLQFPDQAECQNWLRETLREEKIRLRPDVRPECRTVGSASVDIEE